MIVPEEGWDPRDAEVERAACEYGTTLEEMSVKTIHWCPGDVAALKLGIQTMIDDLHVD
jgi:hypothetical protein